MNPIQWVAHYGDETFFQYNEDGSENKYADIDRERLTAFSLCRDQNILVRIHMDKGKRLIYRKRTELRPNGEKTVCYLAGWQRTIGGENVQSIVCVFEHLSTVEAISEWRDGFLDAPELLDFEKDSIS